jgi:hypothetical protein
MKASALDVGFLLEGSTPEALGAHLREEIGKWDKVRKQAAIPQQ